MPTYQPTPFRPHPLLMNAHAQTIFPSLYPREVRAPEAWAALAERREFVLSDGDRLAGVLHPHPDDPEKERPMLVLLHGLEGSVDSHYMRGLSAKAAAVGFHSLRLNFRNCGGTEHLARGLYHGYRVGDVREVLEALAEEGYRSLVLVGVSLGGNLLLKLVASWGEAAPAWLQGAVAVCPAIDMPMTSVAFGEGFNQVYDRFFLVQLKDKVRRKVAVSPDGQALAEAATRLDRVRSLKEFDELITAPFGGFESAADYYRTASSGDELGQIAVPTLIIAAQDDPFVRFEMFTRRQALIAGNPRITTVFPAFGGHVGFYEWPWRQRPEPWMDEYWAENEAIAYIRTLSPAR